jgi:peptidoglycan/LPS O-acetylase OafA/YrhL
MTTMNATPAATAAMAPTAKYNHAIGSLRAFIVVLVIAHHAALAYHPYAPPPPASLVQQPRWWQAFPVVDTHRWSGFSLLVGFNDTFFMSLMFFLSGLFVWQGLVRKGPAKFLRDRLLRLGLPFAVATGLLAPLAYYPTYLQSAGHTGLAEFWRQWTSLGRWPAGPAWFVWLLLVFDSIATLLFVIAPKWGEVLGRWASGASRRPLVFFAALIAISGLAYIPMALHFGPGAWAAFGPFAFQTSRILHYLAYFLIAVGIGAYGLDGGLLAPHGKLANRWMLWAVTAVVIFGATIVATLTAFTPGAHAEKWGIAMDAGFVLSCAGSCFAFLALFLRFTRSRSRFFGDLSENSYGIYLVHYAFVSWMQYALLTAPLPAILKGGIVFVGALGLSWETTATLRRIPGVARIV